MMQATTQIVREETTIMAISLDAIMEVRKKVSYVSIISAQCNVHPIKIKKNNFPFSLCQAALLIAESANVKTSTKEKINQLRRKQVLKVRQEWTNC